MEAVLFCGIQGSGKTTYYVERYLGPARAAGFRVVVRFVDVESADAIARNAERPKPERIPVAWIRGTHRRLEPPSEDEGFDEITRVTIDPEGASSRARSAAVRASR